MSGQAIGLSEQEHAVLSLATEDAFCLWEIVGDVGGDRAVAAKLVKALLSRGLAELGVEEWVDDTPAFYDEEGNYVWVAFTGDVDEALANDETWRSDAQRRIVIAATPAGQALYFRPDE